MQEKFKTNFVATDMSQLTKQTLYDVIADKINFVIDKVYSEKPHYIWLSKYHIVRGSKLFNSLPEDHPIKIPVIGYFRFKGHMKGRQPSNSEQRRLERNCGYALKWPPPGILDTIQTVFRDIEDKINPIGEILMIPCRGYVDQNCRLIEPPYSSDERYSSNRISGYVIYRNDDDGIKIANEYLHSPTTPAYEKYQLWRAKRTAPELRAQKMFSAEKQSAKALERHNVYVDNIKAITTDVDEPNWKEIRGLGPANIDE